MVKNTEIDNIPVFGETLCMNFINTVHGRKENPLRDYLFHIGDLVTWAEKLEVISPQDAKQLVDKFTSDNKKAGRFFKDAIQLRELLYTIFHAVSKGESISESDLISFNRILADHFSYIKLKYDQKLFNTEHIHPHNPYYPIIAPVITDAYSLLLSNNPDRIKECPSCGWLFMDTTKNGKRRWCNMKTCGSSVKALNWYHRQKQVRTDC